MDYILLLIGFVLLIKGADYFVDGASSIANSLKIPTLIIGLTIVAFGTSAPEAAVSITASLKNQNGMAMGNVIGSNIFNLLMVVGMASIIKPMIIQKSMIKKDIPFTILASILMFVVAGDMFFNGTNDNMLSRGDGIVLLIFFVIYMYSLFTMAINSRNSSLSNESAVTVEHIDYSSSSGAIAKPSESSISLNKAIIMSIVGIFGIVLGGKAVVSSASNIAATFGISDQIIGLTVVSIGTSLPEFVTSIIAATKGESDLALGNVIGSNIFNIIFILGISSVISPISINPKLFVDSIFMILATVLIYIFAISNKKKITKIEGLILVGLYITYMAYILLSV